MKHTPSIRILLAAALPICAAASAQDIVKLTWQETGISEITSGMRPKTVYLSDARPAAIRKAPPTLKSPRFAALQLGPEGSQATISIIFDEVDDKPTALIVDANANGDLTDDPVASWTSQPAQDPDGGEATSYATSAMVTIPFQSGPKRGLIKFYQTRARSEKFAAASRKAFAAYADYGLAGKVEIGGKSVPAALQDAGLNGDFRAGKDVISQAMIWLGIPGRRPGQTGVNLVATRPFEVDGKWWALADLTAEGTFRIVESSKPADAGKAPALPPQVDLTGQKAPAFTGKLLGGGEVGFPGDFKGKIVLIDFWATWCGPCVAEIPHVIAAYGKYRDQGLEVLGISLDKEGLEKKLADFTQQKGMPWKQVYEGAFWNAGPAKLYQVRSIPRMVLVDGDSGMVLADNLRGGTLAAAIEKALAAKKAAN